MSKKIRFEITASGEVRAKTIGMKGEECLDYVDIIEHLTDATSVDSHFTAEYHEIAIEHKNLQYNELKEE